MESQCPTLLIIASIVPFLSLIVQNTSGECEPRGNNIPNGGR